MASEPWCIRHRGGWCATDRKRKPGEAEDSSRTVCRHYVVLCWGWERRLPDCPDCRRILKAREARHGK